jgi:hypothetical protein
VEIAEKIDDFSWKSLRKIGRLGIFFGEKCCPDDVFFNLCFSLCVKNNLHLPFSKI